MSGSKRRPRCNKANKTIFFTELDAKLALARRVWKDKGEIRYYDCRDSRGIHYHLTSQEKRNGH